MTNFHVRHSMSLGEGGCHPSPLGRSLCWKNFQSQNCPYTSVNCCGTIWGSWNVGKTEKRKERHPAEHPHFCTATKGTNHLGILVVAYWWNRTATIWLSKVSPISSKAYQGFASGGGVECTTMIHKSQFLCFWAATKWLCNSMYEQTHCIRGALGGAFKQIDTGHWISQKRWDLSKTELHTNFDLSLVAVNGRTLSRLLLPRGWREEGRITCWSH